MSIWYRTGTVTVTNGSKNVVGVDTTFNTSIYPGDLFTVDENVFYEVADVTSNLNFTLQRNYAGTTGSGKAYVVVPLSPKRQLTAELAARVNILIERYRGAIEAWTAGGWAVDTNGDYKVSGDTDRKLVPIENGGGGLGTATKRWGQVHANSVTIAGQAVVPTTTPTASSIPIADSGGKIDSGWLPEATDSLKGAVELATSAETRTGTDTVRAVTPAGALELLRKFGLGSAGQDTYTGAANDLTTSGIYIIGTVAPGFPSTGVCLVQVTTAKNIQQWFMSMNNNTHRLFVRNRLSGTWGDWGMIAAPLLGTVSQSSGVPTGAVIERGSNANGEYVRFADGTQICVVRFTDFPSIQAGGTVPGTTSKWWTFPAEFSATNSIAVSAVLEVTNAHGFASFSISSISTGSVSLRLGILNTTQAAELPVRVMAIGRWF